MKRYDNTIFQEGLEAGMEKGMEKVAKQMKFKGKPIDEVIEFTGLTKDQIEKL